ncbi:hypothetical protein [Alteromonas stellipolaris]|nr:hypothetical protein [Alteromonas stellipolaris]MDP2535841.1 hypothetical protein [Alteromonas stellipolaris]
MSPRIFMLNERPLAIVSVSFTPIVDSVTQVLDNWFIDACTRMRAGAHG